jgi:hypothetical protein
MDQWLADGVAVPRSPSETLELGHQLSDAAARTARREEQAARTRQQDAADAAAFGGFAKRTSGVPMPDHGAVLAEMNSQAELADAIEEIQRERARFRWERDREKTLEELEALEGEVTAGAMRADSLGRALSTANQGWARARQGAGFRTCIYCGVVDGTPHNATCGR